MFYKFYRFYMLSTARFRKLPDFIIVGVQKSGTTSLFKDLENHKNIKFNNNKEIHFFDRHYSKGISWYRSWFPFKIDRRLTGEATPSYIFYPNVIKRMKLYLPKVKLILILRNPVDRAYSHFQMEKRKFRENLSFEEAIKHERLNLSSLYAQVLENDDKHANERLINKSYLSRGLYADQIKILFDYYDKSKILIIESENFKNNKMTTLNEVCDFLGIDYFKKYQLIKNQNVHSYPPISEKTKELLKRYYTKPNKILYKLIKSKFNW